MDILFIMITINHIPKTGVNHGHTNKEFMDYDQPSMISKHDNMQMICYLFSFEDKWIYLCSWIYDL